MREAFALQKLLKFFWQKSIDIDKRDMNVWNFNYTLTNASSFLNN